jgi:hypothetical protein
MSGLEVRGSADVEDFSPHVQLWSICILKTAFAFR